MGVQRSEIVQVLLVGGPLHGMRALVSNPEPRMTMETLFGKRVVYVLARRMDHAVSNDLHSATYVREGVAIDELAPLLHDAEANGPWL